MESVDYTSWEKRLEENRAEQERHIAPAMELLHEHSIREYEASTLMNVYRGLYSSHKAVIRTLRDLQWTDTVSVNGAE